MKRSPTGAELLPDNHDSAASNPPAESPSDRCLECGRPIAPATPHGVCADCSLRNLMNVSFQQTADFGSSPLIDHPEKDVTIDDRGHAKLVDPLSPGDSIGPFRVIRRLGRGGMGTVYEAQDLGNQRRVALKVLNRPVENDEARNRFLREGRLAASINHPNSVFVYGTHQLDRLSLISMELVSGGTLEQRVHAQGPLPPRQAVDAALQIIDGLDAAYALGILHRDIKPANCFEAEDGTIKVGDFGLSISTDPKFDERVTTEGTLLGTPAFSSPEQLRGEALDVRSDIYALGVTLYYLLTGRTPYRADSLVKILSQVFESSPPTPRSLRPEISHELSQLVMRCLAKEPGDRFRNYRELREALTPLSSRVPEPASLGWRAIAGMLDWCVLGLFGLMYTAITSYASEPVLNSSYIASRFSIVLFTTLYILYFGLSESALGQTVGKWLLGLRTIRRDGGRPTVRQAMLRAAVFVLFPSMIVLPYNFLFHVGAESVSGEMSWEMLGAMAAALSYWCLWVAMFSTARSRNGLAGIHDRISDTRVVSRIYETASPPQQVIAVGPSPASDAIAIGPYQVLESQVGVDGARMYMAYDPLLLRRVWLRCDGGQTEDATQRYRTALSRATRLRWLNRITDQGETWDVYEAPAGSPLIARLREGVPPLEQVNRWLGDLARELEAAMQDGTLPNPLTVEQLWLTDTGRLKVLDFVAPGIADYEPSEEAAGRTPPQRCQNLLKSLAPHLRAALLPKDAAQLPPPLYVTRMLSVWETDDDPNASLQTTRSVSARHAVSPKRRRLLMAAACYAFPILQTLFLIANQILSALFFANNDDIRQLRELVQIMQANEPFKNAGEFEQLIAEQPDLEAVLGEQAVAYQRYEAAADLIAAEHRGILDDPRMQSIPAMMHLFPAIRAQIAAVQDERQPSEADTEAAFELLADDLGKQHSGTSQDIFSGTGSAPVLFFALVTWVGYIALPAALAGFLFRGGLVLHGFQAAIVRMNGRPAGRFRILLRAGLAAAPGVIALFMLLASTATVIGTSPAPPRPILVAAAVCFAIVGAIISNLFGLRSIADRLAGTAVVSR